VVGPHLLLIHLRLQLQGVFFHIRTSPAKAAIHHDWLRNVLRFGMHIQLIRPALLQGQLCLSSQSYQMSGLEAHQDG